MRTYFVATKHPEFAEQTFEPGSVVIDPWRYIPDQAGVTVRRLGMYRPAMISVLLPSRGRPDNLQRLLDSLNATVTHRRFVEVLVRVDNDDPQLSGYWQGTGNARLIEGPRVLLSQAWNELVPLATGEILMHAGDDITFDTPGWDQQVRDAFAECEDKILFVHGDDLGPNGQTFGTHGFVHRRWVETVGYFLPPLFSSDWNDVWLNEVAEAIGRRRLLPFVTQHWHYIFGKAERDQTHAEREERGDRDGVVDLYKRTAKERQADVAKLEAVIA